MTRQEVRRRCGDRSVLEIALAVHMTTTGACERDPKEQENDVQILKDLLSTWEDSTFVGRRFDAAVNSLINITLQEAT